jgi:hypothetical protein
MFGDHALNKKRSKSQYRYIPHPEAIERRARQKEYLRTWFERLEAKSTERILGAKVKRVRTRD